MSENSHSHFVVPTKFYVGTFIGLLVLTVVTVGAAQIDLGGKINLILALVIAVAKASLVATFFMGLRWDKGFNTIILLGCLVFLLIFFVFTFADIFGRGWVNPEEKSNYGYKTSVTQEKPEIKSDH